MNRTILSLSLVALISAAPARADVTVANAGFEQPELSPDGIAYSPSVDAQGGSGWVFENYFAGVAGAESEFRPGPVPEGRQVGLIQQWDGLGADLSGFSQRVEGFADGLYRVSFYAAGRPGYGGANPFVVQFDDTTLTFGGGSVVTPLSLTDSQGYQLFASDPIALSAGAHTLRFRSAGPSDSDLTSYLDAVSVAAVPEPSSVLLIGVGLLAAGGRGWMARRTAARV